MSDELLIDAQLEELKQEVEADLGRPMEVGEEIEMKGLFYFAKCVELKNELESEPELLGDICKRALENIRGRMGRRRKQGRQSRIIEAMKEYLSSRQNAQAKGQTGPVMEMKTL